MSNEDIRLIIQTLQMIEVNGKSNLSRLLGCIQFLEKKLDETKE